MKIDLNVKINNLRGIAIKLEIDGILVDCTLLDVCVEALLCLFESERNEAGKSKYKRWKLAENLMKSVSGIVELTVEELAQIKERVGKRYGPAIIGPAYAMLEKVKNSD